VFYIFGAKAKVDMTSLDRIFSYKNWRQRIPLDATTVTPGYILLPNEWEFNHLPERVDKKSFLDVGANDGYFVFEAERRGATRIVATDLYYQGESGNMGGWNSTGITMVKEHLHSKVEIVPKSIYDLQELNEKFDVVLCTNVVSWLDNLNLAIERLSEVCNETLYLKDGFLMRYDPEPVLQYERAKNLVNFRANLSYMTTLLRANGFTRIEMIPVHIHKNFDWQMEHIPMVTTSAEVQIYSLPSEASATAKANCFQAWVLAEREGFYYLRNTGWVKKTDVAIAPRGKRSLINKIIRAVLSESGYAYYVRKRGTETYVKPFMIVAHKH